ncbi:hypothetical protein N656DRAFT_712340 [Canariomyces notabilis]|uniref:Glucosamine 6-phosphate N-acetyltransferase n=1 Tax=Canariomyces notabilis TaxID=2074819 RepID=A0AAN6QJ14_9PEZI|nr:hypothetical protein N656DRAFT_712340 [Canariomyces arenarius]
MGTPFISLLEPTPFPWDRTLPAEAQPNPSAIPRTFLDAMSVRQRVFVQEQQIPQENEFDSDDLRSCHWVIYASVNETLAAAVTDPSTGAVLQPRRSSTTSLPIGTLRLVPFPHPPHPVVGGDYVDNQLVNPKPDPDDEKEKQQQQQKQEHQRKPSFTPDRSTTYHDGTEPYVKLGRLAVRPEFRGRGIARQLVRSAIAWMRQNPSYFDPSPAEQGFEQLGMEQGGTVPKWAGLICVHAQEEAVKVWERCGFKVDEGMGRWTEEGIPHVGMFLRVTLGSDGDGAMR